MRTLCAESESHAYNLMRKVSIQQRLNLNGAIPLPHPALRSAQPHPKNISTNNNPYTTSETILNPLHQLCVLIGSLRVSVSSS